MKPNCFFHLYLGKFEELKEKNPTQSQLGTHQIRSSLNQEDFTSGWPGGLSQLGVPLLILGQAMISCFMGLSPALDPALTTWSLPGIHSRMDILSLSKINVKGAPGWLSRLSV